MVTLYDKIKPWGRLVLLLLAGMAGCKQDSIFYDIANEVAPVDPIIKGTPSKIVTLGNKLYVASGKLYEFDLAGGPWHESDRSGINGQIRDIAATDNDLYALSSAGTGLDFKVWKKPGGTGAWTELGLGSTEGYTTANTIFGAGNQLFAGAAKSNAGGGNDYAILYETGGGLDLLAGTQNTSLLSGAGIIGSDYYLGTMGSGIYKVTSSYTTSHVETISSNIAGFLQPTPDYIIAASRDSYIFCIIAAGVMAPDASLGGTFTGALALTKAYTYSGDTATPDVTDTNEQLLLVGIRGGDNSYSHGYLEVRFNTNTKHVIDLFPREPGAEAPTSIATNGNYSTTLKRYPVTALFALEHISAGDPNSVPIMFASTSGDGFYSYRNRDGIWQWNHEE